MTGVQRAVRVSRRNFTAGIAAASLFLPSAGHATTSKLRTVALLFDSLISPFWVASIAEMRRYAGSRGWRVLEAVSNMDDNRQYAQVQSMLQRGVDGIIMVHTDDKAVIPAIRAANRAGVPLVHFNRAPADNEGYSVAVVADNRRLMRETVERLIAKARARGGKFKAVILLGDLGGANGVLRRDGFEDAVARNADIVQVVARVATEWNPDKAFAGLSNALQAHPDINMVVTSSDFLTPQIEQALRAAGKWHRAGHPAHVLVAGFDGDPLGYKQLEAGYWDVDGVQDLYYEVKLSFEALEAMWAGKRPPKFLYDPGFVADRNTLARDRRRVWGFVALEAAASPQGVAGVSGGAATAVSGGDGPGALLVAVGAFLAALLSATALGDIALALFPLLILVIGQMLVMLTGEIDLSMPAVLSLASITAASIMRETGGSDATSTLIGILACIAIGLAVGAFNGLCVAYLRIPSFILTLAVLMIGGGSAVWYASSVSDSISIGGLPQSFVSLGYGTIGGVPIALLIAVFVALAVAVLLARTLYGRWVYAVGHNALAARIAGVPVGRVKLWTFVAAGGCAGLAAILLTARVETGQPTLGANMLLDIVGAAVIGGISLFGGRGTVWMALAGTTFLVVLDKSLQLLGLSLFLVLAIKGLAILVAAAVDHARRTRVRISTRPKAKPEVGERAIPWPIP